MRFALIVAAAFALRRAGRRTVRPENKACNGSLSTLERNSTTELRSKALEDALPEALAFILAKGRWKAATIIRNRESIG